MYKEYNAEWHRMLSSKKYNSYQRQLNATQLHWDRQYLDVNRSVCRRLQVTSVLVDRLERECHLVGHDGCVNCLEWSSDGRLLASGSDDYHVMIWDPFRKRRVHSINTKHLGNMFSVKFLPRHNDAVIATCAADKFIYVYDINQQNETLLSCNCHAMRVKRLATAPDSSHVFWSAGEDGNILQIDIREQHHCRSEENRVRLISLATYIDSTAEAKCLAVNPRRTEYIAVGSNDPYARIYDRRMLRPVSSYIGTTANSQTSLPESRAQIPKDCVTYYCPGQIKKNNAKEITHEARAITYLTFNSDGTELLVNMGCEHVYLYDLRTAEEPIYLNLPAFRQPEEEEEATPIEIAASDVADSTQICSSPPKRRKLPEQIEAKKKYGNDYLENEKYLRAIDAYSEAIAQWPDCAVLYLNRATALMRRQWFGDIYAALRDCHEALRLDPSYTKAHFRLARALLELGRPQDAENCLKELIYRFPSYEHNHGVLMLHKDICENRRSTERTDEPTRPVIADEYVLNRGEHGTPVNEEYNLLRLSDDEYTWRNMSRDYHKRFVGHCNTTTDIKEANYFGHDGNYIVAGSDDGNFFIYERKSCKIHAIYRGDSAIVNCVQPHPYICMLATSGIDHDIKIWTPVGDPTSERRHLVTSTDKCVEDNQKKMITDPFDLNTRNAYCWNG